MTQEVQLSERSFVALQLAGRSHELRPEQVTVAVGELVIGVARRYNCGTHRQRAYLRQNEDGTYFLERDDRDTPYRR